MLCLAVAVACTSGQLIYPGVYNYPGVLGAYPSLLPQATPITLKAGTPSNIILQTVDHSPITLKTVAAAPITYKTVATGPVSPITYNVAPVAPIAPVASVAPVAPLAPVHSKYHAQDELGQYSFGYSGGLSSRAETRDAFGIVRGSYNYVDAEGKVQTNHYVADGLGFRVSGTNLPVAPEAPEAPALVAPEPVQDTSEVAAAKVAFRSILEKTAVAVESPSASVAEPAPEAVSETVSESVSEDATVSRKKRGIVVSAAHPFASPLQFSYGYSAPLTYSHPAVPYSSAIPAVATYPGIPATTYSGIPAATYSGIPAATYSGIPAATYSGIPAVTTYAAAAPAAIRDANLRRVVHNPNHAVSYRVD